MSMNPTTLSYKIHNIQHPHINIITLSDRQMTDGRDTRDTVPRLLKHQQGCAGIVNKEIIACHYSSETSPRGVLHIPRVRGQLLLEEEEEEEGEVGVVIVVIREVGGPAHLVGQTEGEKEEGGQADRHRRLHRHRLVDMTEEQRRWPSTLTIWE